MNMVSVTKLPPIMGCYGRVGEGSQALLTQLGDN